MLSRRIRLFSLLGFQVWIDASWLLLGALISWTLARGVFPAAAPGLGGATYWWMGVAAAIGLLLSIVWHETAHSLVARHFGIEIRGITLFVFGGVAQMEGEPRTARGEFLMALAGPVSSFVLSASLFGVYGAIAAVPGMAAIAGVVWYLGLINGMLAAFNLAPAFPLDGGRMLRAALWGWRRDILWATRVAAKAGELFGTLLIILGVVDVLRGDVVGGIWQFLIGFFLRGAAGAGYQQTMAQSLLADVPVAQVMIGNPIAVPADLPVDRLVADYIFRYHHREFPVTSGDGVLLGSVGTKQVGSLDRPLWAATTIAALLQPCTAADVIRPGATALDALTQMSRSERSRLFVVDRHRLVGILSQRDLMNLLSVKLELLGSGDGAAAARARLTHSRDLA